MQLNTLAMVHDFLAQNIRPGALCIDATAGKGRDTALLCTLAGETGKVLSFDIQPKALEQTKSLLESSHLTAQLILDSHENMGTYAAAESVDAIVFNFGRLPGGDPMIMTNAASSVKAIQVGLDLLKAGGIMAIALYYGKENGYGERDAILQALKTVDDTRFSVLCCNWQNRRHDPPMPIFIWKE